jgi:hypothetical protein
MQLEKQVCSLEYSKKLKELGFEQDSLFCYADIFGNGEFTEIQYENDDSCERYDFISAFTVAELGEMLYHAFEKNGWDLIYKAYGECFDFNGTQRIGEIGIINLMRKPNMGAKILIYLKENNLLK